MHTHYFNKEILPFLSVIVLIFLPVIGYAAEESITLTTYYPSPYGVYSEMRLYPKAPKPSNTCDTSNDEGVMYYDNFERALKVCRCINSTCLNSLDFDWVAVTSLWTLSGTNLYPNDPAWNVGIGTSTTSGQFEVYDSSGTKEQVYIWDPQSVLKLTVTNGVNFIQSGTSKTTGASADLRFTNMQGANTWMTINSTGKVGIGWTTPDYRLDVMSTATNTAGFRVWGGHDADLNANSNSGQILLGKIPSLQGSIAYSASFADLYIDNKYDDPGAGIYFRTRTSGIRVDALSILGGGNVGIGTTAPDTRLQVRDGNDRIAFYQPSDNRLAIQTLLDDRAFATYGAYGGDAENRLIFQPLIGNVGIGTTSPAFKLDVSSSSGLAGSIPLRLKSTAPETGTMLFQIGAQADTENTIVSLNLWESASKDFTIAGFNLGNVARIKLLGDTVYIPGSVGIGAAIPGTRLAVTGLTGTTGGAYMRYITDGTGRIYYYSSSARYKDDIVPFRDDFRKILNLEPKSFIDKVTKERNIGLIAEDVEQAGLKYLVGYKDGKPDTVEYQLVCLYLLELVKQLDAEVASLKNKEK